MNLSGAVHHLHREVILILHHTLDHRSRVGYDLDRLKTFGDGRLRISQTRSNGFQAALSANIGKIRAEQTSAPPDHVAFGAPALAGKQILAPCGVARNELVNGCRTKTPYVSDYLPHVF